MNITMPVLLNHIDTASNLAHAPSSDPHIDKSEISAIHDAANGLSLWRSILDTHGQEILQCASDGFLDLAAALRLESINPRDLVGLLAKAGRLKGENFFEGNAVDCLTHEADEGTQPSLSIDPASKRPDVERERDQGSDSTISEPSPAEATRGPKRRKKDEGVSLTFSGLHGTTTRPTRPRPTTLEKQKGSPVRQRRGYVRIQDHADRSAMASGRSDPGPPTKIWTMKRPISRRDVLPVATQEGAMPQGVDFIVISDTERESSGGIE